MLTLWKPFEGMTPFRTWVDDMFENLAPYAARTGMVERPRFEMNDEPERYVVTAELPGVKPDEIAVELDGNLITVSYEHEEKSEKKDRVYHRFGAFKRTFTIPENVDTEGIDATMKDGLLTLHLPKTESGKRKTIPIESVGKTEKTAQVEVGKSGKTGKAA